MDWLVEKGMIDKVIRNSNCSRRSTSSSSTRCAYIFNNMFTMPIKVKLVGRMRLTSAHFENAKDPILCTEVAMLTFLRPLLPIIR